MKYVKIYVESAGLTALILGIVGFASPFLISSDDWILVSAGVGLLVSVPLLSWLGANHILSEVNRMKQSTIKKSRSKK